MRNVDAWPGGDVGALSYRNFGAINTYNLSVFYDHQLKLTGLRSSRLKKLHRNNLTCFSKSPCELLNSTRP